MALSIVPFARYKWMAFSYPGVALDNPDFVAIVSRLHAARVHTTIVMGQRGPILVTWQDAPTDA